MRIVGRLMVWSERHGRVTCEVQTAKGQVEVGASALGLRLAVWLHIVVWNRVCEFVSL